VRILVTKFLGIGVVVAGMAGGCADNTPAVERVPVAAPENRAARIDYPQPKPLPDRARLYDRDLPPEPPFDDPPLVSQKTPEQTQFEAAYRGVGRPRITVFVNRTLDGEVAPANDNAAADRGGRVYLRHGQYDEAQARSLDYQAVENILTDVLACQGTVEIMSPTVVRQKLTDDQVKDIQSGRPRAMREAAQQLETDVIVQVSAHPTRQTQYGLEIPTRRRSLQRQRRPAGRPGRRRCPRAPGEDDDQQVRPLRRAKADDGHDPILVVHRAACAPAR